ncbi:MAG: MFS transporter [Pseudomonadota bacterium]
MTDGLSPELNDDESGDTERQAGDRRAPVSGVSTALDAGSTLLPTARSLLARRLKRNVNVELPAYLMVQSSWFVAFGLQMVLFPYLITNRLGLGGLELGLANMALSAPSVIFLLLGGVVAERMAGKPLLVSLHVLAGLPAFALAVIVMTGHLAYAFMILYGLMIGTVGAFMMPARDAILNEVIERRSRIGSGITLQQGVAFATLAQFAAQIAGLILAGYADKQTMMPGWLGGFGIGPIDAWRLVAVQGIVLTLGAAFALYLARGRQVVTGRSGLGATFGDIKDGFVAVRESPTLSAMTVLMFGVGFFVIGSFLVVLPIVNRDLYGLGSDGIRDMFVTFWLGAFLSSVVLSVFRNIKYPGRLLLSAQFLGCLIILILVRDVPHEGFLTIVFGWGLAAGISIAMSRAIVQKAAPKAQLARVLSIYQLGFMAGAPFGAALMGYLTDMFGPQKVAIVPSLGMTLVITFMVLQTPIWNMREDQNT